VQDIERPSREKGLNRIAWNLRLGGPEVRAHRLKSRSRLVAAAWSTSAAGNYTVKLTSTTKCSKSEWK
jgi:hypothetical protein